MRQKCTPTGPEPAMIHLTDGMMISGTSHRIRAAEAQATLAADPNIAACDFCRPDTEVGLDVA
ncbi:DUF6233 domain-containing protein [Streptomyces sp. NRRL S-1448]|uniref:DUF6233 domain-containing protein n=1 Tax=Streptomyces sp. NRRL S-1448 TaxID=1463883 RepID=UPI002277202E|nr:DUF6233 domain-containing protein [Streptomyces sp. NRRL S-1448]